MLLIFLITAFLVWQNTVEPDIIPERGGVLSPYPMAVSVLGLLASPAAIFE
jgi:hypothetical protein